VSNAIDAMQNRDEKLLTVLVEHDDKNVTLIVRDTGGGIEDPARVFEPFYTTKELGASKGLGMGLALSFGLISHFGGQLTCRNLEKGAEFRVDLPKIEGAE
jgi:two-component system C4-dicarboxylate transport sensor histidine kinase DctB